MDVSCSILRETKVGIEVRAHRRHPDPSISALANGLLKRWKSLFSSTAPLAASAKANKQAQRGGAPAHAHAHITAAVSSSSAEAAEAASEAIAVRDSVRDSTQTRLVHVKMQLVSFASLACVCPPLHTHATLLSASAV